MRNVTIASVNSGSVSAGFLASIMAMLDYDRVNNNRILDFVPTAEGRNQTERRNNLADLCLRSGSAWLLQIDPDVTFPPDALDRLLEFANLRQRPIVSACMFTSSDEVNTFAWNRQFISQMHLAPKLPGPDEGPCVPVDATTGAFLLVHRSAFDKMLKNGQSYPVWFGEVSHGPQTYAEDIGFCFRAKEIGLPIYAVAGVGVQRDLQVRTQPVLWAPRPAEDATDAEVAAVEGK